MEFILKLLASGGEALLDYLSAHILTCLVPAFFIAGAIRVFISQTSVLKYFGPQANKWISYGLASISGTILAVCSCTVIPMFAGMFMGGAGIGPATAFLYSGPAINVLAIVYSARLLGLDIGAGRFIGAVVFAVIIGRLMAFFFKEKQESDADAEAVTMDLWQEEKNIWIRLVFFLALLTILIFGAAKKWIPASISLMVLAFILYQWYSKEEIQEWLISTWGFVKMILPWLIGGVFMAGILKALIPQEIVSHWIGGNSLRSNFIASIFGAFMYFATLTEVPIVKAFMELGMGKGPALALLLAGPALSLPNMLAIHSIMGTKRTLTYIAIVVIVAMISGLIFGRIV
ncbi:MAG: permease [bacterium]|nr:MAG: permease [bacterium]